VNPPDGPGDLPSSEERRAVLAKAVAEKTREFRAFERSRGDFEAVLVRGKPVDHRLHLGVVLSAAAVGVAIATRLGLGGNLTQAAFAAAFAYALFWGFLWLTGGEQVERIAVDEDGKLTSLLTGRDPDTRVNYYKVGVPVLLLVSSGFFGAGLVHDTVQPPPPHCNVVPRPGSDACLQVNLMAAARASLEPSVDPAATPSAAPSPDPSASPADTTTAFSYSQAQTIEQVLRVLTMIPVAIVFLAALWFLRRMLTGRYVLFIRPVRPPRR
jgi:hypothetical protein